MFKKSCLTTVIGLLLLLQMLANANSITVTFKINGKLMVGDLTEQGSSTEIKPDLILNDVEKQSLLPKSILLYVASQDDGNIRCVVISSVKENTIYADKAKVTVSETNDVVADNVVIEAMNDDGVWILRIQPENPQKNLSDVQTKFKPGSTLNFKATNFSLANFSNGNLTVKTCTDNPVDGAVLIVTADISKTISLQKHAGAKSIYEAKLTPFQDGGRLVFVGGNKNEFVEGEVFRFRSKDRQFSECPLRAAVNLQNWETKFEHGEIKLLIKAKEMLFDAILFSMEGNEIIVEVSEQEVICETGAPTEKCISNDDMQSIFEEKSNVEVTVLLNREIKKYSNTVSKLLEIKPNDFNTKSRYLPTAGNDCARYCQYQ